MRRIRYKRTMARNVYDVNSCSADMAKVPLPRLQVLIAPNTDVEPDRKRLTRAANGDHLRVYGSNRGRLGSQNGG
jgi:hypothetical protein